MNDLEPEAKPLLASPRREVSYVDTALGLVELIAELTQTPGALAVDAERASGFKYSQRAYLLQLATATSRLFLLDPIAFTAEQLAPLAQLIASRECIIHAATQDLPCLRELGLNPGSVFDTELAARLVGLPKVGLGAVCEHYLGLKLAKEHSAVDWSTRPLDSSWLTYAALDVDVLHELREKMIADLAAQDKTQFADEEFEYLRTFQPRSPKPDRWRSVGGVHEIKNNKQLAIVRELWLAREELAKKLDVSPGRLIPDASIVHAAIHPAKTKPELIADKKFAGRASRTYLDTWWSAIAAGVDTHNPPEFRLPVTGIPNHRTWPAKFPEADARLQALKPKLQEVSEELNIPLENLMTPDTVRTVCFSPAAEFTEDALIQQFVELGARSWQAKIVAKVAYEAFTALGQN